MPAYELSLLLRNMTRPELVSTLKRTAENILDKGGILRKLENLGTARALPYKISKHDTPHRTGSYFLIQFDSPPELIADLSEEYRRDVDIIRTSIFKIEPAKPFKCTLEEELLPPAYRKEVIKMMEVAKRKEKPKYDPKSGLDYYPFQK